MNARPLLICAALVGACSLHAKTLVPPAADGSLDFHFEAGLTYSSGVNKVADQLAENFGLEKKSTWPIGLKLAGYAEHSSGLAVGASVGPFEFIRVEDRSGYHHGDAQNSYIVPASLDLRFFLPPNGSFTPYARIGVSYPFSGGDQIGTGTAGPVGAVGLHVWEHRVLSIGVEAGYDGSQVEVKAGDYHGAEKVKAVGFTFSVFASF